MPRQQATKVVKKFIRGLITESTPFQFPEDAVTEAQNCIFSSIGQVTRRPGLDIEVGGIENDRLLAESTDAYTQFIWPSVAGTGDLTFVVIQSGNIISFYDISTDVDAVSVDKKAFIVDLDEYIPTDATLEPRQHKCAYAIGDGRLVIVNKAAEPIVVEYSEEDDAILIEQIDIQYRDFVGLDDGLGLTERLTTSISTLKTSNPKHYYNLLNQGWHSTTSLTDWDSARTDVPSNADMVALYRLSATDTFDNTLVAANSPGNTQAPRGHFLLNAFAPDRTAAMVAEGFTGASISSTSPALSYTGTTTIENVSPETPANLFDGNGATYVNFNSPNLYIGKTLVSPEIFTRADLTNVGVGPLSTQFRIYGKTGSAPSAWNDGTLLGSATLGAGGSASSLSIISTDNVSAWDHLWLAVQHASGGTAFVADMTLYTLDTSAAEVAITYTRPTTTCFFAGRAWYAGNDGLGLNNSLFFSQIVERKDQYGKCYQANDPTSENFTDLLQNDGGVIKIPEAADIIHIGNYANAVLVFATNGVWAVTGSARQYFTATAYGVRRISSIGTASNSSFVEYEGLPIWWGEAGIYTIRHDPNYDAYSVENLTDETIQTFITNIPSYNRTFVKGAYNAYSKSITWLYNDTASLASGDEFKYTKALQFNTVSKAFYPFTISNNSGVVPDVRGVITCKPSSEAVSPVLKFFCTMPDGTTNGELFAELNDLSYSDWSSYSAMDFSSYFIMGYNIEADGSRNFQPNYVHIFMEQEDNASLYVSGRFDWASSDASGKFSTTQQAYNNRWTNRALRVSRLKMRGHGRALQLKFESDTGKPFTLAGWSMYETSNASV